MRRLPTSLNPNFCAALSLAKHKADLFGRGDSGAKWVGRAKAKVGRRKYEALVANLSDDEVGDEALNSAAAFEERMLLKRSPMVKAELRKWWNAALSTARAERPDALELEYEDYLVLYRAVFRALVGADEYDQDEADESAREEFDNDSGGNGTMSEVEFCAGIFEARPPRRLAPRPLTDAHKCPATCVRRGVPPGGRARRELQVADLHVVGR